MLNRELSRVAPLGWMTGLWAATALFAATLSAQPSVLTWHNDNARTGQNLQESILTWANVNVSTFGRLFTLGVDGKVDGQPLYVPGLTIPGQGVHNVLYVATEHDSVYAFDADNGTLLKKVTLLGTNETTSDVRGCSSQVSPEIGVTATSVIDPFSGTHGTIYVVAMSKDQMGNYYQRLHALDLTTLAEEFGGPVNVTGTAPTSPEESTFEPGQHKERAALLLVNGVVYTSWSSHCDIRPYTSWIIGFNEYTLATTYVLNLEPNGIQGGIWAAGSGPQADAAGSIYIPTGNGTFDTTLLGNGMPSLGDFGNAYVRLAVSGSNLVVADYFTMSSTVAESDGDTDLGSGGGMLLPPLNDSTGHSRQLAVVAGKDHNIYVMDRTNLGKFNPNTDEIFQQLTGVLPGGEWSSPAWFNGVLYYGDQGQALKAFVFSNGKFNTSPSAQSSIVFQYPGTTPSISANGTSNGIVWAVDNGTATLFAYQAGNMAELYDSNQAPNGRDQFGVGNKFMFPTIANGKVYVASDNGTGQAGQTGSVGVFGLLIQPPAPVSVSPNTGTGSTQAFTFTFSNPGGANQIEYAQIIINSTLATTGACYLYYVPSSNSIYLASNSGASWQGPLTLGSSGTSANSQCSINSGLSSGSISGTTLTLNLELSFLAAFAGPKQIYMELRNGTLDSGLVQKGTWTVPGVPQPAPVSVAPNSGTGSSQMFTLTYSDPNGATDIVATEVDINATTGTSGACYLLYTRASNSIQLADNSGTLQSALTVGTAGTSSNSQCSINAGTSSMSASGNTLTLNLALTFTGAFAGAKNTYMEVRNASFDSGLVLEGTWTIPAPPPPAPVSVAPNTGNGSSQLFTFTFSDPNGAANIKFTQIVINSTLTVTGACYLYYAPASNQIYLANDAATFQSPLTVGNAGTSSNSQCSINSGQSSVSSSGTTLTLSLMLSFTPAFAGTKNIYMDVKDGTQDSGLVLEGNWTIPGNVQLPPAPVSVSPNTGNGSSQLFTFTFSDPNEASNIKFTQIVISSTLTVTGACYLYYAPGSNLIYLANDAAAFQSPLTVGSAGTSSNSQCSIDSGSSSVSTSGTTLTLSLMLSFTPAFAGTKNIYMDVKDGTLDSGLVLEGSWTVPGPAQSPPTPVSVSPNSGNGSSQLFTFTFSDPNAAANISFTQIVINSTLTVTGACYLYYAPASNQIYLANDAAAWQSPLTVGSAGTSSNSQCSINSGLSSVSASGTTLTLNLMLSFTQGFAGTQNIYMDAGNSAGDSGNQLLGTWTVP